MLSMRRSRKKIKHIGDITAQKLRFWYLLTALLSNHSRYIYFQQFHPENFITVRGQDIGTISASYFKFVMCAKVPVCKQKEMIYCLETESKSFTQKQYIKSQPNYLDLV